MQDQHTKIPGYRDFDQLTVDQIGSIKAAEIDVANLFKQMKLVEGVDQRALALAKTKLQEGFSWFVRAIAKPTDPFEGAPVEDTWLTRMQAESEELTARLHKLDVFLADPVKKAALSEDDLEAMCEQQMGMRVYLTALNARLERVEKNG